MKIIILQIAADPYQETGMSDNKRPDEDAGDAEHKRKMAELFGDLDDSDDDGAAVVETLEGVRAHRDELLGQVTRLTDSLMRSQADNLTLTRRLQEAGDSQKRSEAKFEQDKKYAIEKFIKELLPVVDTLELGLKTIEQQHCGEDPKYKKLAEGVEKTLGQLTAVFNKFGVRQIDPMGAEFDPSEHEALAAQEKDGVDPETVIHVAQKGYKIEDRVIRPAKVIVTPPQ